MKTLICRWPSGNEYLRYLIEMIDVEQRTCLRLAFEHRPTVYFFRELVAFVNCLTDEYEWARVWPKAWKFIDERRREEKIKTTNIRVGHID
jgi:hypothetical protein